MPPHQRGTKQFVQLTAGENKKQTSLASCSTTSFAFLPTSNKQRGKMILGAVFPGCRDSRSWNNSLWFGLLFFPSRANFSECLVQSLTLPHAGNRQLLYNGIKSSDPGANTSAHTGSSSILASVYGACFSLSHWVGMFLGGNVKRWAKE